jgi:hypothetical protein
MRFASSSLCPPASPAGVVAGRRRRGARLLSGQRVELVLQVDDALHRFAGRIADHADATRRRRREPVSLDLRRRQLGFKRRNLAGQLIGAGRSLIAGAAEQPANPVDLSGGLLHDAEQRTVVSELLEQPVPGIAHLGQRAAPCRLHFLGVAAKPGIERRHRERQSLGALALLVEQLDIRELRRAQKSELAVELCDASRTALERRRELGCRLLRLDAERCPDIDADFANRPRHLEPQAANAHELLGHGCGVGVAGAALRDGVGHLAQLLRRGA